MRDKKEFSSRRRRQNSLNVRQHASVSPSKGQLFQRSRTLTGTTSSRVASATEKKGLLLSGRLKAHNLRSYRRILAVSAIGSWTLAIGCLFLIDQYIGSFDIYTPGTALTTSLDLQVQNASDDYFETRPFERFRFATNDEQYSAFLQERIPEVAATEFGDNKGVASAVLTLSLRAPVAQWKLGSSTYYVDKDGVAFENNHFVEPSVSVDDQSGLPPTEQRRLASRSLLAFIGQSVALLDASPNEAVKSIIIPRGTLKQIDIVVDYHNIRIKTYTDREPTAQIADAIAALSYMRRENERPAYIDVRVAGKAYYR